MRQTAIKADPETIAFINGVISSERSLNKASIRLGISRSTLATLAAGAPVRRGTLALIRERLRELEHGGLPSLEHQQSVIEAQHVDLAARHVAGARR